MKVRCIYNDIAALDGPRRSTLEHEIHTDGPLQELDVGFLYPVCAMEWRKSGLWFFVHSIEDAWFPTPYPAELFEVSERDFPPGWSVDFYECNGCLLIKRIAFSEWAKDDNFYEQLVEGEPSALEAYRIWLSASVEHT